MRKVLQFKGLPDPGQQQEWRRAAISGRDLAQTESVGFGREPDQEAEERWRREGSIS